MKNNMLYKVGDKVRIVEKKCGECWAPSGGMDKWLGKVMTIRAVVRDGLYLMAEDDHEFYGGWCWHEHMIAGLATEQPEQKVVITTDGKTTLARLYDGKKVIKRAEAKCSPHDEFDFKVGAELAFSRLMSKDSAPSTEWKVVKRKAKEGDYIRLTCKSFDFTEVGDILKVHRRTVYVVKVLNKDHPRGGHSGFAAGYEWNYAEHEYEVVEPVKKPCEKETPKSKYKAGDKVIVIANTCAHRAKVGQVITLTRNNMHGWGKDHWYYKEKAGYIRECDFTPYADETKVYNGKVVCIKTGYDWWTVGKVYEVKDGIITHDDGGRYPKLGGYRYKDADDVRHAGCADGKNYNPKNEFIPLVEEA